MSTLAAMTLYKYLSRPDVILNRKIRYSQIYALNDPFEGRPYFQTLAPDDVVNEILTDAYNSFPIDPVGACASQLVSELRETLGDMGSDIVEDIESAFQQVLANPDEPGRSRELFAEFIGDELIPLARSMGPEVRQQIIDKYNSGLGILCLSRVRDSNLMWAHYAANSRGVVIGLDDKHSFFESPALDDRLLNRLFDVEYSAERPSAEHMIQLPFQHILLTKPLDWEYESERRHVRLLAEGEKTEIVDDLGEPVYLFEYPADLLEQVVFGSRMTVEIKENIIRVLDSEDYQHVKIFEAHESETRYELLFEQTR